MSVLPLPTHNYDFRVAETTSVNDLMGSGGVATYQGSATSDETNGVIINNSDNTNGPKYVSITPPTITDTTHSIEVYFKLTTDIASYAMISSFIESTTGTERWISTTGSGVSGNTFQNNNAPSGIDSLVNTTDPTSGTLYHAVISATKNGNIVFYINNAATGSNSTGTVTTMSYTATAWELGRRAKIGNNYADITVYYTRWWDGHALSASEVSTLYSNRETNYFDFSYFRLYYGDAYLAQTLNKTLEDYKAENIPLHDISFGVFSTANKYKSTYIQGPVDISGALIVRSNKNIFYDISATKIGFSNDLITPKIITNDLSLNNRFFVGGDASFNSNVTIQGDLSYNSTFSYTNLLANSLVNVSDAAAKTFTQDISLNANLAIHGKTTVKNDLYLNAYTDVSANPVLSDGTYLKNMKMDKLNHQYIMDISRSAPFSTLTSKTLPSEIWDSSANSGICISADGKYIRTVNLSDVSANATSYYSEDYGSSFHKDESLSRLIAVLDVSLNDNGTNYLQSDILTKFGADKVYMSYNGQHQLVPRGWHVQPCYADYLYVSNDFGNTWNIRKNNNISSSTYNYTVTANSSTNYILNGETYTNIHQPEINIDFKDSIVFTIDSTTNSSLPFKIGTTADGGEITDSRITSVTSGSNQIITFKPTVSGIYFYYCSAHSGMGNSIVFHENPGHFGKSWAWYSGAVSADGKNMFVSGSEGIWRSQDFGTNWYNTANDMSLNNITISATGQHVYGIVEREVYGSSDYGSSFSKIYTDPSPVAFDYSTITSSSNTIFETRTYSDASEFPSIGGYSGYQNRISADGKTHIIHSSTFLSRNYPVLNSGITTTDAQRAIIAYPFSADVDDSFKPNQTNYVAYTSYMNGSAMSGNGKYIVTSRNTVSTSGPQLLIRSEDYGNTWLHDIIVDEKSFFKNHTTDFTISAEGSIASNYAGDRWVYSGVNSKLIFSKDYGKTWTYTAYDANGNQHATITVDGSTSSTAVFSNSMGASMSDDGQYFLVTSGKPANSSYSSRAAWLSTDYGLTFNAITTALDSRYAIGQYSGASVDMSKDGQHMGIVVANDSYSERGLYISNDYGSTWTKESASASTIWIRGGSIHISYDGQLMFYNCYVLNGSDANNFYLISKDYGVTWSSPYSTIMDGSSTSGVNNFPVASMFSSMMSKNGQYIYVRGSSSVWTKGIVPYTSAPYSKIETSGNGKYVTIADTNGSNLYMSSDYGNSFTLHTPFESGTLSKNCGMSHSGKIVLNSNYISFDYGNNFTYVPNLISDNLSNRDTFYSKANLEYILDASNNSLLQIPYKSAQFQDIYSVGSIKAGSTTYSSDYRLKENVQPLTDNETVNELRPVKYYNTNLKKNDYGLIAHELQEKYPFLVSGEKDGAEKQSINYNGLISLLVHEVKNLKKEYLELRELKK